MSIAEWVFLGEAAVSGIAFVVGFIALKRGKTKTAKTLLQIGHEANEAAQKKFDKICKKNKVSTNEVLLELKNENKE